MFFSNRFRKGQNRLNCHGEFHQSHLCHFEPLEDRLLLSIDLAQQAVTIEFSETGIPEEAPLATNKGLASGALETIDQGDYYYHFDEKIRLLRVATEYLVHLTDNASASDVIERLTTAGGVLSNVTASVSPNSPGLILKLPKGLADVPNREVIDSAVRAVEGVAWMAPVFVGADSGSHGYLTGNISVALAPGVDPEKFFATGYTSWERFFANQYIATVADGGGMGALELANMLSADSRVEWAAPSFYSDFRVESIPDDALFPSQWSLNNTGQMVAPPTGAKIDADADLPAAWDVTTGSQYIVVGVLDNGVQTNHPDLNIFVSTGEIAGNSIDDDLNGYIDDVNGWDFAGSAATNIPDNNPNPETDDDNHGTAVAGVVGARGGNGIGVTGASQNMKILPVKIARDDTGGGGGFVTADKIAKAVYYAAGIVIDAGIPTGATWRAADILVNSWGGGMADPTLTAAFDYIQTHGRAGLGVASFNASGNAAAGTVPFLNYYTETIPGAVAGNWQFEWRYTKDGSAAAGEDSSWLGNIQFPNGTTQRFDTLGLPSGWSTSGNANWSVIDDPSHTYGTGRYVAKAGTIGNSQTSNLRSPTINVAATGSLTFSYWVSSEAGFDGLRLFASFNGGLFNQAWTYSGVPSVTSQVDYPASLASTIAVGASTDWDYRSAYSQYGSALDIVAPSGGGYAAIATTDRTGAAGYNLTVGTAGDYMPTFNGTSAATPLVAGIAALMLSKNWNLTTSEIRWNLQGTADKIGGNNGQTAYAGGFNQYGFNQYYGYGRVNAAAALAATRPELIGDVNFSNTVTPSDVLTIVNIINSGQGLRGPVGDADHNHIVDMVDYNLALAHVGEFGTYPPAPDLVATSDLGPFSTDNITADNTPEFKITAPPGWYVQFYVDGALQDSRQLAAGQTTYNFTTSALISNQHTAFAKVSENESFATANLSILSVPMNFEVDTVAPRVSRVLVGSTAWHTEFEHRIQFLGEGTIDGYGIRDGANQLKPLWFTNANQIVVVFSENVDAQVSDLTLSGVTVPMYSVTGFSGTSTGIWTLAGSIDNDDLTIRLEATASTAVQDIAGNKLDGEWTNSSSQYPSGDGMAGGNFVFRFDVLPADVNQDRVVNIYDINLVSTNWDTNPAAPVGLFGNTNGDQFVDILDINAISAIGEIPMAQATASCR